MVHFTINRIKVKLLKIGPSIGYVRLGDYYRVKLLESE